MRWLLLSALLGGGCDTVFEIHHINAIDAAIDAPRMCPADYDVGGGTSPYRLVATAADFVTAASDCADDETATQIAMHTHLAVVSDATEMHLLYTLGNNRWIGLSDLGAKGSWRWVTAETGLDPSAADTVLWSTGEPNNPDLEHCAHLDSGHTDHANNVVCSESHTYACECDAYANDPTTYP